jgi:hypothetical protein
LWGEALFQIKARFDSLFTEAEREGRKRGKTQSVLIAMRVREVGKAKPRTLRRTSNLASSSKFKKGVGLKEVGSLFKVAEREGFGQALVGASRASSAWPPRLPFARITRAHPPLAGGRLVSNPSHEECEIIV